MTELKQRKTKLKTRVSAWEHRRQLVIELDASRPAELLIRESGKHKGYWVPFTAIYTVGARLKAEEIRKVRAQAARAKSLRRA
jgi:hypothetical protein